MAFTVFLTRRQYTSRDSRTIVLGDIPHIAVQCESDDGLHLVLGSGHQVVRLCCDPAHRVWNGIFLPVETYSQTRAASSQWLLCLLNGNAVGPSPEGARLTAARRDRMLKLLRLFDLHRAGLTAKQIAARVMDPGLAGLSAAAWAGSSERKRLKRWLVEAGHMIRCGYLDLLHAPGDMHGR